MKKHYTVKAHTVRMLRAIKRKIMNEPKQFVMDSWFWSDESRIPNCHTAACIAGWAITCDLGVSPKQASQSLIKDKMDPGAAGMNALRLTMRQAYHLFLADNWPQPFDKLYHTLRTPRARARVACQRIDHFIKTGQ